MVTVWSGWKLCKRVLTSLLVIYRTRPKAAIPSLGLRGSQRVEQLSLWQIEPCWSLLGCYICED
jgi:hypothetical protein